MRPFSDIVGTGPSAYRRPFSVQQCWAAQEEPLQEYSPPNAGDKRPIGYCAAGPNLTWLKIPNEPRAPSRRGLKAGLTATGLALGNRSHPRYDSGSHLDHLRAQLRRREHLDVSTQSHEVPRRFPHILEWQAKVAPPSRINRCLIGPLRTIDKSAH